MSERKVLNKYYPLDYDPAKIPKLHLPRSRQFSIRIMVPFNCRCNLCGEYIYKGKKFNSRSELVEDENYLGVKIRRFYIRCPRCVSEISFKTDPEKTDYELEGGAVRNFEPLRTAEQQAQREKKEKDMEEANNPMKVLENRTKASWQEMEMLETLAELKELNSRHATVDHESILQFNAEAQKKYEENLKMLQDEKDEKLINSIFGKTDQNTVKRLADDEEDEDQQPGTSVKKLKTNKPTDILVQREGPAQTTTKRPLKKFSNLKSKSTLGILVKKKTPAGESKGQSIPSTVVAKHSTVTTETSVPATEKTGPNLLVTEKAVETVAAEIKNTNSISRDDFSKKVVSTLPSAKIQESSTVTSAVSASNPVKLPSLSALGMLGSYTDSESDHSE